MAAACCAMKGNIKWIAVFTVFCIFCAGIWIYRSESTDGYKTAQIVQDGKIIRTIDLSSVKEPYEFEVKDEFGGNNTIRVERGRIAVVDADCPDKVCVNQGYIDNGAVPIVCLPHKLSITITDKKEEIDAVVGAN